MSHPTLAANKIRLIVISFVTFSLLIAGCSPAAAPMPQANYAVAPAQPQLEAQYCCSTGGNKTPNDKAYDATFFENYGVNPFIDTEDDNLSTFAMDVDTASYTVLRRFLTDGNLPDKDAVRTE
jgi:Ca-activated chloride channel family protein